ncbi:MAG: hypothetical protein F6K18_10880 [Okeania sp. SIO2C2]|uniref:hypothetical protein n=1 Tax=Okeania sp. SIO2C2 TaxID=2607787 RepID=UPI0013B5F67E|nr:hypothetical protein [Okeania sp. SIO2C2]NEP87290.1 hypothetical protein [Okeania sp. SIO2C2]
MCIEKLARHKYQRNEVFGESPRLSLASGQRELRQTLKRIKTGVKNQLGRQTDRPTLGWIFQCFQSVHVFFVQGVKQISNLTNERLHLLKFFPQSCQGYDLLI